MSTIGTRINQKRKQSNLSQSELADKCGFGPSGQKRISTYESDTSMPSYTDTKVIAEALGTDAAWLMFGGKEPDGSEDIASSPVEINVYADLSVVDGLIDFNDEKVIGKITLNKQDLAHRKIDHKDVIALKVAGNSMAPTIPDSSVVAINRGACQVVDGDIYLINQEGLIRLKKVYRTANGYRLSSFNKEEWPDEHYNNLTDVVIIGRLVWTSSYVDFRY